MEKLHCPPPRQKLSNFTVFFALISFSLALAACPMDAGDSVSVTVSPAAYNIARGGTHLFTAKVEGTNNPDQTVTWSVEGGGEGTTISDSGLLTVAADEEEENLTVRAVSAVDPGKYGTAAVMVYANQSDIPPTVTRVTVSPAAPGVIKGQDQAFTAVVEGTNNPDQTVTWSVDGGREGTTINRDSGRLTVAADETAQTLTVRAVSTFDPGKYGTASVTVYASQTEVPTVTSVTVSPGTISVEQGGTQTFTAEVEGTNDPAQTVAWYVDGGGDGTAIDRDSGVLTVAADETALNLTVRAVSDVSGKSGTASVTVTGRVIVSPAAVSVGQGGTIAFTAEIAGNDEPSPAVTWSVVGGGAGTSIGSASGVLTVAENETAETLTVRAVSTVSGKSGTANVTVLAAGKASVILVYPADDDEAAGELSGLTDVVVTLDTHKELAVNASFDSYRWQVDGFVKGTANTFTLNAGDYSPGIHQLSLEVTLNGMVYSKSGAFTVQH